MKRETLITAILCVMVSIASAEINFTGQSSLNVSSLNFSSLCGLSFDDQTQYLWVSDGSNTNAIAAINPSTGQTIKQFSAEQFGIQGGPDSLAVNPLTSNIFVSSAYSESKLVEITSEGELVQPFTSGYGQAASAFTPDGQLILMDKDNGSMQFYDILNDVLEDTINIIGYSNAITAADYDPITGNIFGYIPGEKSLIEIDIDSGQVISITDMLPYVEYGSNHPTGIAFNTAGDKLFYCGSNLKSSNEILVLTREVPEPATVILFGLGSLLLRKRRA